MQVQSLGQEDPLERAWQPAPLFLPGESHGQRSLTGYSPWGRRVRHDWSDLAHIHIYMYVYSSPHMLWPINKKGIVPDIAWIHCPIKRPKQHWLAHGLIPCCFTLSGTSMLQKSYRVCPLKQSEVNLPWAPWHYQKNCLLRLINRPMICFLDFYFLLYECFHPNITNTCSKMSDNLSNCWNHREIINRSRKNLTTTTKSRNNITTKSRNNIITHSAV